MLLAVVGAVVLVRGVARGASAGARAALAARAEFLAHAASWNTHTAHTHTPTNPHSQNININPAIHVRVIRRHSAVILCR